MLQYLGKNRFPRIHRQPSPDDSENDTNRKTQSKLKSKKLEIAHLLININILNGEPLTLTGQP